MHLLKGQVHCWQIVFWNSWVSWNLNLRHHFLHCLVSGVYQPECVIHYTCNKWYNCIDLLWDFIKASNWWSHHCICNDGTSGHWCFCWWLSAVLLWCPPPPFEEPEGRAYCLNAGVSVCQSIISSRSFSSQRQCTYQKSNLVYRFIIY